VIHKVIFKNSRWWMTTIMLMVLYLYISSANQAISIKFGVETQILILRMVTMKNKNFTTPRWQTNAMLNISFQLYFSIVLSD